MTTETTRRTFGCSLKVRFGTWSYSTLDGWPLGQKDDKTVKNPPEMRWTTTWAEDAGGETLDLLNDRQDRAAWNNPAPAWRWLVAAGCGPAEADRLIGEAGLLIFSVFYVAAAPALRTKPEEYRDHPRSFFLAQVLLPFACAFYLRFPQALSAINPLRPRQEPHWKTRKLLAATTLARMKMRTIQNPESVKDIRQNLLKCVNNAVSELLKEPHESICANLLAITSLADEELTVVARSNPHRDTGPSIQKKGQPHSAWKAIELGARIVEDDFRAVAKRLELPGTFPYRSIFALPVTHDGKAYGVLSIDSTAPYAFVDRETDLEYLVQPYLAALYLTFGADSQYYSCPYNMPRH
jgi:hypothetical protein